MGGEKVNFAIAGWAFFTLKLLRANGCQAGSNSTPSRSIAEPGFLRYGVRDNDPQKRRRKAGRGATTVRIFMDPTSNENGEFEEIPDWYLTFQAS